MRSQVVLFAAMAALILLTPAVAGDIDNLINSTHNALPVEYPEELYVALTKHNYEVFDLAMDEDYIDLAPLTADFSTMQMLNWHGDSEYELASF